MSNIAFMFSRHEGNPGCEFMVEVWKDNVLTDEQTPVLEDLTPVTFDDSINADNNGSGPHTIKLKITPGISEDKFPVASLKSINVDGSVHDDANNWLMEHVKVYNLLTPEAAVSIASGENHSDGTVTVDLGLGDGEVEYYYSNPWNNGGQGCVNAVYVLTYEGNFTEWYNNLGYIQ